MDAPILAAETMRIGNQTLTAATGTQQHRARIIVVDGRTFLGRWRATPEAAQADIDALTPVLQLSGSAVDAGPQN